MRLYRDEYDLMDISSTLGQGWLTGALNKRIAGGWRPVSVGGSGQHAIVLLRRRRWFWQKVTS